MVTLARKVHHLVHISRTSNYVSALFGLENPTVYVMKNHNYALENSRELANTLFKLQPERVNLPKDRIVRPRDRVYLSDTVS